MTSHHPRSAWPAEFISAIEDHAIYALKQYLESAAAPVEALDLMNNLIDLATYQNQSSPEACELIDEALSRAVQNLASLNVPFHSPYAAVTKDQNENN
jgi:hypothetical protein